MKFGRLIALLALLGSLAGMPASAQAEAEPVTVLAAGDIAFCERSLRRRLKDWLYGNSAEPGAPTTAALLDRLPGTILVLGDLAYWRGTEAEFEDCYDPSWGRHKARSRPVPGNHEYRSPGAAPYYAYWDGQAGQPDMGYYSFDLGAWHLIGLNSSLEDEAMAEQQVWLGQDLAASKARCVLAYAHHPRFSSGKNRDQVQMAGLYRLLYQGGVSLFLAGHDHNYERFAPMDQEGRLDPERGIRSFVVGTGGGQLKAYGISDPPHANSEVVDGSTWGVLALTLHEDRYDWAFVPAKGGAFEDSGSADCVDRLSPP